jgi:hypothetical protein
MKRKLRLDVEDLCVESFSVTASMRPEHGTVRGMSLTEPGSDSWGDDTCGWTCGLDCDRTVMLCDTLVNCGGGMTRGGGPSGLTENDGGFC